MNKTRRNRISKAIDELRSILNEEQDVYDNIPENLLDTDRASESEEAINVLEDVIDQLEDII